MGITLPDYVKHKHRMGVLIWGAALLFTLLLLFLVRTPVTVTAVRYADMEQAYKGLDKAVVLSGETTTKIRLSADRNNAYLYGYSYSVKKDEEEYVTLGLLGGKYFLIERDPPAFSWMEEEGENMVYTVKDAADVLPRIQEVIGDLERSIQNQDVSGDLAESFRERIDLLSRVEPLMLKEYRESELRPFAQVMLWIFLIVALVFFVIHALPLLCPAHSKTGACFRTYGLRDDDTLQLDADNYTEGGFYIPKGSFLSRRYLSVAHYSYVFIAPVRSLLWVYPAQVISSSRYGATIRWYLECWFTDGRRQRLRVEDKKEAAALSVKVHDKFPGVLAGFNSAVYRAYDGKPEKLHDFQEKSPQWQPKISPKSQADVKSMMWGMDEEYQ